MKKTINFNHIIFISLMAIIGFSACNTKTPPNPNEEELITTVSIHLRDSAGIQPDKVFRYVDADGDGGNMPTVFDTIQLMPGTTYFANLYFINDAAQPADTINKEIIKEAGEHLICFTPSGSLPLGIQILDKDGANLPLGLQSKWVTGTPSSNGSLRVTLRHQPGNKNGTCEPGSADADLTFQVKMN